jgi:pyridoxal 5'-phosphate synthase pdxT subunit
MAGAASAEVKHPGQLGEVDALILPGGESTTIGKLLARFELLGPLKSRIEAGMALYGTCAGMILMAKSVSGDEAPHRLEVLDVAVRRNAYGRQADSFEADLDVDGMGEPFRAVFIRAPAVEDFGDSVEVLARHDDVPVLVRQGRMLASSFHPEMTGDTRIHQLFVDLASD